MSPAFAFAKVGGVQAEGRRDLFMVGNGSERAPMQVASVQATGKRARAMSSHLRGRPRLGAARTREEVHTGPTPLGAFESPMIVCTVPTK